MNEIFLLCQKILKLGNDYKFNSVSAEETKIDKFANSVDPDEVAHNEPPHLDLHCLPSSF